MARYRVLLTGKSLGTWCSYTSSVANWLCDLGVSQSLLESQSLSFSSTQLKKRWDISDLFSSPCVFSISFIGV